MKLNTVLLVILVVYAGQTFSGVYKQVDEHGNVTYSNVRSTHSEEVDLPPLVVVPSVDAEGIDGRIKQRRENAVIRDQRNGIEQRIADETAQLDTIKAEYKGGQPDRLGSERNYQRYLNRVERLKNEISVRERKLDALHRELEKVPEIK